MASLRFPERSNGVVTKLGDHIESRFCLAGRLLREIHDRVIIARYPLYDHSANRLDPGIEEEDVEKRIKSAIASDHREESMLLSILNASIAASTDEGGKLALGKKGTVKVCVSPVSPNSACTDSTAGHQAKKSRSITRQLLGY